MRQRKKAAHGEGRLGNILFMGLFISVALLVLQLTKSPHMSGPFQAAAVDYVVDGDTLYVNMEGEKVKIRLLSIDTPESVSREEAQNTPQGAEASAYVKELLPRGTPVYLEFEEERFDRYGRTLADVWLSPKANPESYEDFCRYHLSAVILQNTWCEIMAIPPNTKYVSWLKRLESEGRTKK